MFIAHHTQPSKFSPLEGRFVVESGRKNRNKQPASKALECARLRLEVIVLVMGNSILSCSSNP
ncbi:MAG: hypothetical protein A2162_04505 [Deltaproteobacteria bacterium RBG_13_52_11b]|nr:MAG: hypothetical protein A2162_04505 [Deltaproteobacteria bacterium RBG_13_52_11b]